MLLNRLGWLTVHHRLRVLAMTVLLVVVGGVVGVGVFSELTTGGFADEASESERARVTLLEEFEEGAPNLVVLVTPRAGTVDAPDVVREGEDLTRQMAGEPGVEQVWSYFSPGSPQSLRSGDGTRALVLARIGGDDDQVVHAVEELSPEYTIDNSVVSTSVGGSAEIARQTQEQIQHDLERAEIISTPVLIVLLVLVFGSVVAGALPFAIGLVAVVGTFFVLQVIAFFTDVSIFAVNLTTALGLGLAIDYSLFIVARFREERRSGLSHEDAVVRAVETAGRTIMFSAAIVAASLSALLVFPTVFLRSFAYAGIPVVLLAAVGAIVVLPALLAVVGARLDRWQVRWRRAPRARHQLTPPGFWHRVATRVMRRPVLMGGAVLALLVFLGSPFLGVQFGFADHRVLPEGTTSRTVQETVDEEFARGETANLYVVARDAWTSATPADVAGYAERLSDLDGVSRVDAATGSYVDGSQVAGPRDAGAAFVNETGTWLAVVPSVEAMSPEGERLVEEVRALPAPFSGLVGGPSAQLVDTKDALFDSLPLALGVIAFVTFGVLFLFTGGLLVPVKGLVLNLLSLSATFGAMVWVFQEGHLSELLGFTPTGTLDTNMPILMFCVAFGLSMDYEVFLLSRIKERYDVTGDNRHAVAWGLESTGRLVSAAALLLAVVFVAFATSGITFIKLMGLGTALAIVMDATLVRGVLVPAFMRLAGDANWWAPRPLRRLHARIRLREGPLDDPGERRMLVGSGHSGEADDVRESQGVPERN
ncbi:MMPL family transporter [Blastococcus mobilis]|uniref:Putative drug exporter of the RND superfamily n=1 Tax=Blastococcus mobilis TaxID=1938746 RepID=A0A238URC0_9ACTN|nr:MMPL family transporter [Blastococcus mobilis]SNR24690.1 putative drug exporter of the RND superfamily [Blastococcus mobilis]